MKNETLCHWFYDNQLMWNLSTLPLPQLSNSRESHKNFHVTVAAHVCLCVCKLPHTCGD